MLSPLMPVVVGITGFAQSGKSSCGEVFESMGYTSAAFADPLCAMAEDINPVLPGGVRYLDALQQLGYEGAKARVPGFREFLKDLGTSARRRIGEDVWVRGCVDGLTKNSVVTDMRFVNERDALVAKAQELGGHALLLRVERPGVCAESAFEAVVPTIPVDFVVCNDGTLDDLRSALFDLAGDWMLQKADRQGKPMLSRTARLAHSG